MCKESATGLITLTATHQNNFGFLCYSMRMKHTCICSIMVLFKQKLGKWVLECFTSSKRIRAHQTSNGVYQDVAGIDVTGQIQAVALNMYYHPWAASGHAKSDPVSSKQKLDELWASLTLLIWRRNPVCNCRATLELCKSLRCLYKGNIFNMITCFW